MAQVTLSEFRKNLAKYLNQLESDRTELVVTRQNHEPMLVMPLSDFEGLRETLYLLSTPANAEHLRRSIADAEAGRVFERDLMET